MAVAVVPPPVLFLVVVHPSASPASLAIPAVGRILRNNHFFLKYPNFGLGFAGAAASAAVHSCNTAASHVI